jgi:hypothetical protein
MLHAGHSSTQVRSVITITGLGDHDQPDWLITMTGMRSQRAEWSGRRRGQGHAMMMQPSLAILDGLPACHLSHRQPSQS